MTKHLFILIFFLCALSINAAAQTGRAVALNNGVTNVDIVGDGSPGMIVYAHRENFNAHSLDVASFYIKVGSVWSIVSIFDGSQEKLEVTVSGGADCLINDFRLLPKTKKEPATLVAAQRKFGDNYADDEIVTFKFYELNHNTEGVPGNPEYYFKKTRKLMSQKKYCDVTDAFKVELGL